MVISDQEWFTFGAGTADPDTTRRVVAYLTEHPAAMEELRAPDRDVFIRLNELAVSKHQPVPTTLNAWPTRGFQLTLALTVVLGVVLTFGGLVFAGERSKRKQAEVLLAGREHVLQLTYKEKRRRAEETATVLRSLRAAIDKSQELQNADSSSPQVRQETRRLARSVRDELARIEPLIADVPTIANDKSRFVADVTYADGSEVPVGTTFAKTWKVKNVGAVPWRNRFLQREGSPNCHGQLLSEKRVPIPDTEPGEEVQITVDLRSPDEPGFCYAEWKMVDDNGDYLLAPQAPLRVQIVVITERKQN